MRINVAHATPEAPYVIPPDNPFVEVPGARPEIWAYGLRNPWRFSFDSQTGDLWVSDVGEGEFEEVNIIEPGRNYGWPAFEGSLLFDEWCDEFDCSVMEPPLWEFNRVELGAVCAVIGGFVYRGDDLPSLHGAYLLSDHCAGTVWALRRSEDGAVEATEVISRPSDSFYTNALVAGPDGEPYLVDGGPGAIRKLMPSDAPSASVELARLTPPELLDTDIAVFFATNCAACHGGERQGGVGPTLPPGALTQPDAVYINTIMNGGSGRIMPAWSRAGLSEAQVATLVQWLKTTDPSP